MILIQKIFPTQILFISLKLKGSAIGAGIIPLNVKKTKEMLIDFRKAPVLFQISLLMAWKLKLTLFTKDVSQEYFALKI